jgi:DNA-binding MarR family transcriptional regulator
MSYQPQFTITLPLRARVEGIAALWERMGQLSVTSAREKLVLRPRQERLLKLLGESGGMTPAELWEALKVSKQGAMDLLRSLLLAGLFRRVDALKTGRYVLQ